MLFCRNFKFLVFDAFFPQNLYSQNFRVPKKKFLPNLSQTCLAIVILDDF